MAALLRIRTARSPEIFQVAGVARPTAGTYTIEISTFNGLDTGAYALIVEATPPKPVRQVLRVKR